MSHSHQNLLGEPAPTLLPPTPEADAELAQGATVTETVAHHPTVSALWAALAEESLDRPERQLADTVEAYAYARTGYHRGLDALRRNGWKGHGPVPWSHEPNRGFLRSCGALLRAADAVGEAPEVERLRTLIAESDPEALAALGVA